MTEKRATKAERRATDVERRAAKVVTIFLQSSDYRRELADATNFAYDLGFQDCKIKVRQVFDLDGVEGLEPDLLDQPSSTPAQDDTTPAKP